MKKSYLLLFMTLVSLFLLSGCNSILKQEDKNPKIDIKITKHPSPAKYYRGKLESFPSYNPNSTNGSQVDLRSYDLSSFDLKDKINDLMYADFDSNTIWPESMPDSFDPLKIMELGKNPGLGVKKIHEEGITGKGVGIAIIDQKLLVDHVEYKDNLKMYEEIHCLDEEAQMHGPAVASIAVGKTIGVAPEADLYYIAETHGTYNDNKFDWDLTWLAKSIDRVLEVNKPLPKDKKIRVISISVGWNKNDKGYGEITAAVQRAKEQGIFVISTSLTETYEFNGLGRSPLKDPDLSSSYEPGLFWANGYYSRMWKTLANGTLLIPMDSRTTASPTGNNDYVFYRTGGLSWSVPYIAGLYALACQVKPDITPDIFWSKVLGTGDTIKIPNNGKEYDLKRIVNPARLMEAIEKS